MLKEGLELQGVRSVLPSANPPRFAMNQKLSWNLHNLCRSYRPVSLWVCSNLLSKAVSCIVEALKDKCMEEKEGYVIGDSLYNNFLVCSSLCNLYFSIDGTLHNTIALIKIT